MRVLHLLKTSTGAAWALRQMTELVKRGLEVHVALPSGGPLFSEYAKAGVRVHAVDSLGASAFSPRTLAAIRECVAEVQPSLIHSHFVATTLATRIALGRNDRIPRVFQVPGPLHLEHALTRGVDLATAGRADFWLASCRWTFDRYRQSGIPEDRLGLVYYGRDVMPEAVGSAGLREALISDDSTKLIGMVAYFYAPKRYLGYTRGIKGHEDFIDAVALLRERGERVVGIVVGGPWRGAENYAAGVRAYAERRCGDAVRFLGHRNDVFAIYRDLDLAVHPSHSENLGGALESMLAGVPTVATRVGGFPDLLQHQLTGWLASPKDPSDLAATILAALNHPQAAAIASSGQLHAKSLCDIRRNVEALVKFYERMLASSDSHRAS